MLLTNLGTDKLVKYFMYYYYHHSLTALDVLEQWGDAGPIQPKHIREAVRKLRSKNTIPNVKKKKVLLS